MPRIPGIDRQIITQRRAVADLSDPTAIQRAGSFARGAADLANVGMQLADREKAAHDATKLNKAVVDYKKDNLLLRDRLYRENNSTPEGISALYEEEAEKLKQQYIKTLPDKKVQRAFTETAQSVNLSGFGDALTWQRRRGAEVALERTNDALKTIYDRSFAGGNLEEVFKDIDASVVAASTLVNDDIRLENLREGAREQAIKSAHDGYLSRGQVSEADALVERYKDTLFYEDEERMKAASKAYKKTLLAQAEKEKKKQEDLQDSRIELALEAARSPQDLVSINKSIDEMENTFGEEWANKKRIKLLKANEEYEKEQESIVMGSAFANGQAVLNPENTDHKKAADSYYRELTATPEFQSLQPEERNAALVSLISNNRYVPETLKGEITAVGRSNNVEELAQAADLLNKTKIKNPYIVDQLGSPAAQARIEMIDRQINAGVQPQKAIEEINKRLDPLNAPTEEKIKQEINAKITAEKIDFSQKTQDAFRTWGDWFSGFVGGELNQATPQARESLDMAAAEYRTLWENAYRKYRDFDQADEEAKKQMGLYNRTTVNPSAMIMKFPPEAYYQIENQDNAKWIRKQAVDDAMNILGDSLLAEPLDRKYVEENLYIVPHPRRTPQTAAIQKPEYSLILMRDDVPVNLTGQDRFFRPDPQLTIQSLLGESKLMREIEKQYGGASLQMNLAREREMAIRQKDTEKAKQIENQLREMGVDF